MDELDMAQRLKVDQLAEEYQRRHGVAVEYLKAEVGPGDEYANAAARVVISPNGAWFECIDLPMEFSGVAGGPVPHRFISDGDALALLDRLYGMAGEVTPENTRTFSLLALYTRTGIVDGRGVYIFHYRRASDETPARPQVIGDYLPQTLPFVFRCRLDTDLDTAGLPVRRGVLVCLTNVGENHLLVEMPYEGDDVRDLTDAPINPVAQ